MKVELPVLGWDIPGDMMVVQPRESRLCGGESLHQCTSSHFLQRDLYLSAQDQL